MWTKNIVTDYSEDAWYRPEHNVHVGLPLIYFGIIQNRFSFCIWMEMNIIGDNECLHEVCECNEKKPFLLIILRQFGNKLAQT